MSSWINKPAVGPLKVKVLWSREMRKQLPSKRISIPGERVKPEATLRDRN